MKAFDLESLCRLRAIRVHNVTTPVIISKMTSSYPELLAVCKPNALKLAHVCAAETARPANASSNATTPRITAAQKVYHIRFCAGVLYQVVHWSSVSLWLVPNPHVECRARNANERDKRRIGKVHRFPAHTRTRGNRARQVTLGSCPRTP